MRTQLKRLRRQRNGLVALFLIAAYALTFYAWHIELKEKEQEAKPQYFTPKDFITELPPYTWTQPIKTRYYYLPWLNEYFEFRALMLNVSLSVSYLEYEYIGRYFITAYSPEECGFNGSNYPKGWTTSTGTICHYSEDWRTPTTCAIDPKVRKYGEYILVGDPTSENKKLYVAEDCGPGVRGCWVDCFQPDYYSMSNFNTRYDNCYLVRFKTKKFEGNLYEISKAIDEAIKGLLMPDEINYYEFGG